jgi:hypothetical protein
MPIVAPNFLSFSASLSEAAPDGVAVAVGAVGAVAGVLACGAAGEETAAPWRGAAGDGEAGAAGAVGDAAGLGAGPVVGGAALAGTAA